MTWFSLSANETEAANTHVAIFLAVDFNFLSGHARFWTGYGNMTISGNVFTGAGSMGRVTFPNERAGLDAARKTYQLSGAEINPMLVTESDIEGSFNRSVIEYFGFLNITTGELIAQPEINWEGRIDSVRRVDGPEPRIEVNADHRMLILDKRTELRRTDAHQQQFFAGDTGYSLVNQSLIREFMWGGRYVGGGSSLPGGGGGGGGGGQFPFPDDGRGPGGGAR